MTQTQPASPAYEILFAFTGAAGTVVEIKRLGLPADAPRSRKYQWLWIAAGSNPQQALPLQFVSMSQGHRHERVFAEGTLRFGERDAQWSLHASEAQHHLKACLPDAMPPDAAALVACFVTRD